MATAAVPSTAKQYAYHDLQSLVKASIAQRGINVIAVVKFFRGPMKSRGTSYAMTLGLTDPSLAGGKMICTVFNDSLSRLPQVASPGDVVIFHRLIVEPFSDRGEMRGCGLPGMGFASAVVDGAEGASLEFRSGWSAMNITEKDLERVRELRTWYNSSACPVEKESSNISSSIVPAAVERPTIPSGADAIEETSEKISTKALLRLEELNTPNTYFDLVAHVIALFRLDGEADCVVLRVWDGTIPALPMNRFEDTSETSIVERHELKNPRAHWLARHRYVDIFIFDEHASIESMLDVRPNSVVLLTNLHLVLCRTRTTPEQRRCCELRLHGGGRDRFGRGVRKLKDSAGDLCVTEMQHRLVNLAQNMQVTCVAERYKNSTTLSLNQLLALPPVTWKYKVRARVAAVHPPASELLDCLHWFCAACAHLASWAEEATATCPHCSGPATLEMAFQLLLEDSDGWLLAKVWAADAARLFSPYLRGAGDLVTSGTARQRVATCLRALPGNDALLVLVTYLPAGLRPEERQYRVVDTEVVA